MAQVTEAACLIDQGAMFPNRQGFRDSTGKTVLIGFKPGACSIYFDDEPIYHFDLEGRWQRAFIGVDQNDPETPTNLAGVPGRHYLKSLDTTTTSLVRIREGSEIKIHRQHLGFSQTVDLDDHVRQMAMNLHARIASGELQPINPPSQGRTAGRAVEVTEVLDFLERIAAWDTASWTRQKERFLSTFGPLPMAPPGAPGAMTLQSTLGDSGTKPIGFGGSDSTELYVRSPDEFQKHLMLVLSLWGRRMPQARGIFLAGSNVIHQPMSTVIDVLDQIQEALGDPTIDIAGRVIDPPRTLQKNEIYLTTYQLDQTRPTVEMLQEYAKRGLVHLTIGVESALPEVREIYERTWQNEDLANWLQVASEGDIKVSLVWLVGSGGAALPENIAGTINLIESLPLPEGTIIYFMDAAETASASWKQANAISESNAAIVYELRNQLQPLLRPRKVKVAHYTLDKEWQ